MSVPKNTLSWPDKPLEPAASVIQPGDEIEVTFRYWPELNATQIVRADGKVSLQLIDDFPVAGLTVPEADEKLTKLYESQLVDPVLTIIVRTSFNQRVFVGGEVNAPGVIQMPGKLSALEAVFEAGGFNFVGAEASTVVIVRTVDGKRYAKTIDLQSNLSNAESETFYLAAGDIVYVPRTKIFQADQWVDQNINKLIPGIVNQSISFFAFGRGTGGTGSSRN